MGAAHRPLCWPFFLTSPSPPSLKSGLGLFSNLCDFHPPVVLPSTPPSLSLSRHPVGALTLITPFIPSLVYLMSLLLHSLSSSCSSLQAPNWCGVGFPTWNWARTSRPLKGCSALRSVASVFTFSCSFCSTLDVATFFLISSVFANATRGRRDINRKVRREGRVCSCTFDGPSEDQ